VVWTQVWLLVCAIDPVFSRLHEGFALMQGFSLNILKVPAEYDKVCMDIKVLVGVVTLQEGETEPVGSLSLEDYYVTRTSLRQFLEGEILSFTIIDRLVSLVAMSGAQSSWTPSSGPLVASSFAPS
jgi:hypothetical protein